MTGAAAAAGGAESGSTASARTAATTNTGPASNAQAATASNSESVSETTETEVSLLDRAAMEAAAPPRYGKFGNDADAVYKAWENADKALNGKADKLLDQMDRNDLYAKMVQRGVIEAVPEQYENLRETFREAGMEAFEDDHPSWGEFHDWLKEGKFTQKQTELLIRKYGEMETANAAQWGTPANAEAENAALEKVWGQQTGEKKARLRRALMNAVTNGEIPMELFNKPLKRTAWGLQFLDGIMQSRREPRPITQTNRPNRTAFRVEAINAKINELMRNPAYRNAMANDHHRIHEQVDRLHAQKYKLSQS